MHNRIRFILACVLAVACIAQLVIDTSTENATCSLICFASSLLIFRFTINEKVFFRHPLSAMVPIFYAATNLFLPAVVKTLDLQPLTYNLSSPIETFGFVAITGLIMCLSHAIFRTSRWAKGATDFVQKRVFAPLRVFDRPTTSRLYIMGVIGVLAMVYVYLIKGAEEAGGSIGDKILQGLAPFAYAPFIIYLRPLFGTTEKLNPRQAATLGGYLILILVIALGRNSRATVVVPMATLGIGVMISVLLGKVRPELFSFKTIVGAVAAIAIAPLATNLLIGMQLARAERGNVSATEMVYLSIEMMQRQELISSYSEDITLATEERTGWSERYVQNRFLSRLIYTKYHDNAITLMKELDDQGREDMTQFTIAHTISFLPDPVLRVFTPMTKSEALSCSYGDYLFYLAMRGNLGGFRVGSMIGNGLAIFNVFYPLLVFFATFLYYVACDCFVIADPRSRLLPEGTSQRALPFIAPVAIINTCTLIFFAPQTESFTEYIGLTLRGFTQMCLLYFVFQIATQPLESFFRRGDTRGRRPKAQSVTV